ncbi:hypothetical protein SanaruYs_07800 [Chryseotalea sanaruensis]|uniref:Uncharacterized protein n=1 Tax=Chryseotalea sanaruensis TaxID=2482724 RepID=A0A401U6Q2_9BACT|nr:hypothetical protein [Chryseotalea sanaruensis]GCC50565.1 hypothetical protein SanaruYs_07800 [Chryseotalea sanaruensis]
MKKPEGQTSQTGRQQPRAQGNENAPKPLTFEDLLKEITEAKDPYANPSPQRPVQEFVSYDEEIEEETTAEQVGYDYRKEETYKTFEENKFAAFNRLSYEDTMKVGDTDVSFGKFKAFEEDNKPSMASEIMQEFSDPERVKRAFIMGEIFNRKYA